MDGIQHAVFANFVASPPRRTQRMLWCVQKRRQALFIVRLRQAICERLARVHRSSSFFGAPDIRCTRHSPPFTYERCRVPCDPRRRFASTIPIAEAGVVGNFDYRLHSAGFTLHPCRHSLSARTKDGGP